MEIYVAYKDYNWMMDFTERMLERICMDVNGTTEVKVGDNVISFKAPFARVTMTDAIKKETGFDITGKTEEELRAFCKQEGIEVDETYGRVSSSTRSSARNAKESASSPHSSPTILSRCRRSPSATARTPR